MRSIDEDQEEGYAGLIEEGRVIEAYTEPLYGADSAAQQSTQQEQHSEDSSTRTSPASAEGRDKEAADDRSVWQRLRGIRRGAQGAKPGEGGASQNGRGADRGGRLSAGRILERSTSKNGVTGGADPFAEMLGLGSGDTKEAQTPIFHSGFLLQNKSSSIEQGQAEQGLLGQLLAMVQGARSSRTNSAKEVIRGNRPGQKRKGSSTCRVLPLEANRILQLMVRPLMGAVDLQCGNFAVDLHTNLCEFHKPSFRDGSLVLRSSERIAHSVLPWLLRARELLKYGVLYSLPF